MSQAPFGAPWSKPENSSRSGINMGNLWFTENFLVNYWADWGITPARIQVVDVNGDGRDDAAYSLATSMYVYYGATGIAKAMNADTALIDCNDPGLIQAARDQTAAG